MSRVRVTHHPAGYERVHDDVDRYIRRLADLIATIARAEAPDGADTNAIGEPRKRTGPKLRDSIIVVAGKRRGAYIIRATATYARAVHQGTKPYVIVPKRAKVLRFVPETGEIVFAAKVTKEAKAGNPFLVRALRKALR